MKKRMLAAMVGLSVGVLVVHDIPLANYLRHVETDRLITGLERDSFVIVGSAHEAIEEPSKLHQLELKKTIANYVRDTEAVVLVTDRKGRAITSTDSSVYPNDDFSTRPEIIGALKGEVVSGRRFSKSLNYELLYVAVPVIKGEQVYGTVRITFPAKTVDQEITKRLRILEGVAGVTILLAILLALLLSASITRRLSRLQQVTNSFSDGDYSVRADVSGGANEIRSLAQSFNDMAEKLSILIAQQREFAGDASHQLRTPLTALKLRLEQAKSALDKGQGISAESLDAALLEMDRLQNIVEGLLVLSRVENRISEIPTSLNLTEIVKNHVEQWQALAAESQIELQFRPELESAVLALPGVIEQVLDNYIDNALHVSSPGSRITIAITKGEDFTILHVVDQGPGLSTEECDKAFNRFWRAQSDEHGSGLGLAIVQRLMEASGGSAELIPVKPHGIDARASFKNA